MQRLIWIDRLRGLAIFLVLLFHSTSLLRYGYDQPSLLVGINNVFSPFRMASLAFLAGFISHLSLRKGAFEFFKGKINYLVWPYVIWTAVYYFTVGSEYGLFDHELYISYLWYLPFLFFCYTCVYLFKNTESLILCCLFLTISILIPSDLDAPQRVFFLAAVFFVGKFFSENNFLEVIFNYRRFAFFLMFTILILVSCFSVLGWHVRYNPAWFFPVILGVLMLARFVNSPIFPPVIGRMLSFVGQRSIVFYCVHFPIIYFAVSVCSFHHLNVYLTFLFSFLFSFSCGFILALLQERSRIISLFFYYNKK